jgi:hypothetical protein
MDEEKVINTEELTEEEINPEAIEQLSNNKGEEDEEDE